MSIVHKFMAYPVLYTAVYKCASEINKSASGAKAKWTSPIYRRSIGSILLHTQHDF